MLAVLPADAGLSEERHRHSLGYRAACGRRGDGPRFAWAASSKPGRI